jgi:hypothetical protein
LNDIVVVDVCREFVSAEERVDGTLELRLTLGHRCDSLENGGARLVAEKEVGVADYSLTTPSHLIAISEVSGLDGQEVKMAACKS